MCFVLRLFPHSNCTLQDMYLARHVPRFPSCVLSTFSDSQSRQLHLCVFCITYALDSHGSQQNWRLLGCDDQPDRKQSAPADLTNNVTSQKTPADPNQSSPSHAATRCLQYSVRRSRRRHKYLTRYSACHTCSSPMSTSNNSACHNSR
jgi:hypothetical protein